MDVVAGAWTVAEIQMIGSILSTHIGTLSREISRLPHSISRLALFMAHFMAQTPCVG